MTDQPFKKKICPLSHPVAIKSIKFGENANFKLLETVPPNLQLGSKLEISKKSTTFPVLQ